MKMLIEQRTMKMLKTTTPILAINRVSFNFTSISLSILFRLCFLLKIIIYDTLNPSKKKLMISSSLIMSGESIFNNIENRNTFILLTKYLKLIYLNFSSRRKVGGGFSRVIQSRFKTAKYILNQ
jgi:hypothetical protein